MTNKPDFKFVDYSQMKCFLNCPYYWYERYVNCVEPKRPLKQRDDALTLGSLVHAGLENWYKHHKIYIDDEVVTELNPTPECNNTALLMLEGYAQRYPQEPWELVAIEEPIVRPLRNDLNLLAKVDAYFYAEKEMVLETTSEGQDIVLTPGFWGQEYKTKSPTISRANWIQNYERNLQPSFQMLALEYKLGEPLQGVIVNVLEKPRVNVPKRKCQGCGDSYELASFIPYSDKYACPICGHLQKLKPYEPRVKPTVDYFRRPVQRSREELDRDWTTILTIAERMDQMRSGGKHYEVQNTEACVSMFYGKCGYFEPHRYNRDTLEDPNFEIRDTSKYVGLDQIQ